MASLVPMEKTGPNLCSTVVTTSIYNLKDMGYCRIASMSCPVKTTQAIMKGSSVKPVGGGAGSRKRMCQLMSMRNALAW
eukprot:scaffold229403_cov29-Tisochrysis_lutea.AAC.2